MILKEMTTHECRRNDELGSAGAPARCVTRLAGHSSGGFRRARRKERARRWLFPNSSSRAGLKNLNRNAFNADFPALSAQQSHPDANLRVCLSKVRPELRRIPVDA